MNKIKIYFVLLLITYCKPVFSNSPIWEQINNENGIQVFIQNVSHSEIIRAKVSATINAPFKVVQQTLDDIDRRHEWIPFLQESKLVRSLENNKRIEYSLFSAPWPASDREFLYSLELIKDSKDEVIYKMHSVTSELMPDNEQYIRGYIYESRYTLKKIASNKTHVELIYHADPKGWLPNWIINIIQRIFPYKLLFKLKERLESIDP